MMTLLAILMLVPLASACEPGWLGFHMHCYTVHTTERRWSIANTHCREELGAELASIHSSDEEAFISDELYEIFPPFIPVWIGAHDVNGQFYWSDGTSGNYSNWNSSQTAQEENKCVRSMSFGGAVDREWTWGDCNTEHKFICKKKRYSHTRYMHAKRRLLSSPFPPTWFKPVRSSRQCAMACLQNNHCAAFAMNNITEGDNCYMCDADTWEQTSTSGGEGEWPAWEVVGRQ